mmetsp:Transcript_26569/g.40320  ORF Transcript_26569/g.40320 Transcript_26569/m.40320 type:complete len:208 (+) Transcript_26569:61-684(+)
MSSKIPEKFKFLINDDALKLAGMSKFDKNSLLTGIDKINELKHRDDVDHGDDGITDYGITEDWIEDPGHKGHKGDLYDQIDDIDKNFVYDEGAFLDDTMYYVEDIILAARTRLRSNAVVLGGVDIRGHLEDSSDDNDRLEVLANRIDALEDKVMQMGKKIERDFRELRRRFLKHQNDFRRRRRNEYDPEERKEIIRALRYLERKLLY